MQQLAAGTKSLMQALKIKLKEHDIWQYDIGRKISHVKKSSWRQKDIELKSVLVVQKRSYADCSRAQTGVAGESPL
jgi:hypothetical protein